MTQNLLSFNELFSQKLFRIPDYQRGYAWKEKQLVDFWEDIINLQPEKKHYTGTISVNRIPEGIVNQWVNEAWIVKEQKYTPFYIVDGQQRLTTSTILIHSIIEIIKGQNPNMPLDKVFLGGSSIHLKQIQEQYIFKCPRPGSPLKAYIFGYEKDNPSFDFLKQKIFGEDDDSTIEESFYTLNLAGAKDFFLKNLRVHLEKFGLDGIQDIYTKLVHQFQVNFYEISSDFDVFVAFETMNNRGKQLSDLELLKNRLIYLTTLFTKGQAKADDCAAVREKINNAWKEVYKQLGRTKDNPLPDDEFLRAHWIMYFKYSRNKGNDYIRYLLDEKFSPKNVILNPAYTLEQSQINAPLASIQPDEEDEDPDAIEELTLAENSEDKRLTLGEIHAYVKSLNKSAKHWHNSWNPQNTDELTQGESEWLERLNRIGMGYFRPLVMASFLNPSTTSEQRVKLFRAIDRFIFLVLRVSRAQANYKSSEYYRKARQLFKQEEGASIEQLTKELWKLPEWVINPDNSLKTKHFLSYLERKFQKNGAGFYGWNGLRYLLYQYEEKLKKQRGQPKCHWRNFVQNDKDKISIEHIYPQTSTNTCWEEAFGSFSEGQQEILKGSLGNLLPLSLQINSSLQNQCFKDKKKVQKNPVTGDHIRNGYENGSYSEQEVGNTDDPWTAARIKQRGLRLLQFLEKEWDVSLGNEEEKLKILHLDFLIE